jgi:hypothetical protein
MTCPCTFYQCVAMELYGGFIPTVISKNDIQMLLADNILLIRL